MRVVKGRYIAAIDILPCSGTGCSMLEILSVYVPTQSR